MEKIALSVMAALLLLVFIQKWYDVPAKEPQMYQKILAFGDSLTFGYGAEASQSYPAYLSKLLGVDVINEGVNGELSREGVARLPLLLEQYRPDLVILCHGGNDILQKKSLEQLQRNVEKMAVLAQQSGSDVLLVGVPDLSLFGLDVLPLYERVADRHGLMIESDVLAEILSDTTLKSDSIHPNALGYAAMAQALYKVLQNP